MFRFFKEMIAFRRRHPSVRRTGYFTGEKNERGLPDIAWHGCALDGPGWLDPGSSVLAFTLGGFGGDDDLHVMLNMSGQDLDVPPSAGRWPRLVARRRHLASRSGGYRPARGRNRDKAGRPVPRQLAQRGDPALPVDRGSFQGDNQWTRCISPSPTLSPATSRQPPDSPTGKFGLKTSDGREFQVQLNDATYAEVIRNPSEQYKDPGVSAQFVLTPGRFIFAYGIFYPEGGDYSSRPSISCWSARTSTTGASSRRTGGSIRSAI